MSNDLLTGNVNWDEVAARWRYADTGRFVSENVVRAELERHVQGVIETTQNLTRQMYAGQLNLSQWETAVAQELKSAHLAQSMFANGGVANMTSVEYGRVGGTLRDEYRYLHQFALDVQAGKVSELQAINRVAQYGNDSAQSYWKEYARQQENAAWNNLPRLTRVPQDGSTQCHGNCKCYLSTQDDGIYWYTTALESCGDCIEMRNGNPYRPMV